MNLIKSINESLKAKDTVKEAIDSLASHVDSTHLDDEQIEMLADYMKEMIDSTKTRGNAMDVAEAAHMALEDVAGFETASKKALAATVARLVRAYTQKFGE